MTETPLLERIANALQTHRETTLALQELASELQDFAQRVRELTDRLEGVRVVPGAVKGISQTYETQMDVTRMPMVLRGGPQLREG